MRSSAPVTPSPSLIGGNMIRQGPISDLLAGADVVVEVDCSAPEEATSLLAGMRVDVHVDLRDDGVTLTMPTGTSRDAIAEVNRRLVEGGTSVYRLQEIQVSLESWFLEVTRPIGHAGMTSTTELNTPPATPWDARSDHRGSWIPTWGMIETRFMELRRRRGLMIAMVIVVIGVPTVFLLIRIVAHAVDPTSYVPAGGYDIFTSLTAGVMYIFGFIMAATLGCTAGSIDLTEGMFRHLVVTGRSRVALYFARIPAGLAIVVSMVAVGFVIVCAICCLAAPRTLQYNGVSLPAGMSSSAFDTYAANHESVALCNFGYNGPAIIDVPCRFNRRGVGTIAQPDKDNAPSGFVMPSAQKLRSDAIVVAKQNYYAYSQEFLSPSTGLMVRTGLWLELEAAIGFIVGLGLGSLLGQRTVAVIMLLVYEIVLTPLLSRAHIAHLINIQRGVVGLATAHLEPSALPFVFGGGNGGPQSASGFTAHSRIEIRCRLRNHWMDRRVDRTWRAQNGDPRRVTTSFFVQPTMSSATADIAMSATVSQPRVKASFPLT